MTRHELSETRRALSASKARLRATAAAHADLLRRADEAAERLATSAHLLALVKADLRDAQTAELECISDDEAAAELMIRGRP